MTRRQSQSYQTTLLRHLRRTYHGINQTMTHPKQKIFCNDVCTTRIQEEHFSEKTYKRNNRRIHPKPKRVPQQCEYSSKRGLGQHSDNQRKLKTKTRSKAKAPVGSTQHKLMYLHRDTPKPDQTNKQARSTMSSNYPPRQQGRKVPRRRIQNDQKHQYKQPPLSLSSEAPKHPRSIAETRDTEQSNTSNFGVHRNEKRPGLIKPNKDNKLQLTPPTKTTASYSDNNFKTTKKVSFSTVEVRRYERCLGDHEWTCPDGPALSLGWRYISCVKEVVSRYEWARRETKGKKIRPLPGKLRIALIQEHTDCTWAEIKSNIEDLIRARRGLKEKKI